MEETQNLHYTFSPTHKPTISLQLYPFICLFLMANRGTNDKIGVQMRVNSGKKKKNPITYPQLVTLPNSAAQKYLGTM